MNSRLLRPLPTLRRAALPLLGLLSLLPAATAKVELPSVFGDHMVVQQQMPVVIWGKADANEEVTASLAGKSARARADRDGLFRLELPALEAKANAGPLKLVVKGKTDTLTFTDVAVGEVWLCGGQSNMEFELKKADGGAQAAQASANPAIRFFRVYKTTSAEPVFSARLTKWTPCDPQTTADFSAAGYFFGRKLNAELGVPVGLLQSTWGGTPIDSWTPLADMAANPVTRPIVDYQEALDARMDEAKAARERDIATWKQAKAQAEQEGKPFTQREPRGVYGVIEAFRPGYLYNGMIAPLAPLALRGVIWYQGESNGNRAKQYETLLPMMIAAWRREFHNPEMAFGIVQLAAFRDRLPDPHNAEWAELRDAQLKTFLEVPHTGLTVTVDIGDAKDIHPKNKIDVGDRLAAWALADVYGRKDVALSGPIYKSMKVEGDRIVLSFDHIDGGLEAKGGKLEGFAIAGSNHVFRWADAVIEGDTVVVSSPEVPQPEMVRYAWADNPAATLMNKAGLPASPFRTDSLEGMTEKRLAPASLPDKM